MVFCSGVISGKKKNCSYENILSILDFAREYGISTVNFALAHRTDSFCLTAESEREKEDIINWVEAAKKNSSEA